MVGEFCRFFPPSYTQEGINRTGQITRRQALVIWPVQAKTLKVPRPRYLARTVYTLLGIAGRKKKAELPYHQKLVFTESNHWLPGATERAQLETILLRLSVAGSRDIYQLDNECLTCLIDSN
jgi:hypothetical protein